MPDIRYVCLSDMHLGEEDSLLTNLKEAGKETDPAQPSPVMKQLVECLEHLISKNDDEKKPTLILNGDILELALTTTNEAAMAFERFVELIMPPEGQLFEKILYIPGNHDHHLWELARETQYVDYITRRLRPGEDLPVPWHRTKMFVENDPAPVPSYFLTKLVNRFPHLTDVVIPVAYPNLGLITDDGQRGVVFHHGHFIESIYQLMSILKNRLFGYEMPAGIDGLEAENFAWIDFFWSTLGRSGEVGASIETIYEHMHDEKRFKKLLSEFADNLAERYDLPGWGDWMEANILKGIFHYLVDKASKRERRFTDRILTLEAEKGMQEYANGPLRKQILSEQQEMPSDVTVVFGHTHKPFQEDMSFKEYQKWVNVYNTGGWVVETIEPKPIHGGAVLLIDENLNATSLRMYNEAAGPAEYSVRVEEATHTGAQINPLHQRMAGLVNPSEEPWKTFSDVVARSVHIRAQNLRARIMDL
ncbi:MAG: metallophosphoesterase [bacterium]|nr:metallophosphoesterase [bacterium]